MNVNKVDEYRQHKWFACQMDEGFVASANTLKELLAKFGRSSAKYVRTGEYEFYQDSEYYRQTVNVYKGIELAKCDGYDIDDHEHNTWHLNE